jgi:hypothetical protein
MRIRLFVIAGLMAVAGVGHAAEEFIYTVQPGDHPWNIAQRYLRDTTDALRLMRLNRITNDRTVPPGTRLRIPAQWLKLEATAVRLMALHGEATITRGDGASRAARSGEDVAAGSRVRTGERSSVMLVFEDGSRVLMRQASELRVVRSDKRALGGGVLVTLELVRGGLENMVIPRTSPDNRFEIRSPAAVAAVRGTRFRVNAGDDRTWTEVLEGAVDVDNPAGQVQARAGQGTVAQLGRAPQPPEPLLAAPDLSALPSRLERLPIDWPLAPVPGAVRYRTQLAPDAGFTTIVSDEVSAAPRARVLDIADDNYVMRVLAIAADGLEGVGAERPVQVYARPVAPLLISPPPAAETTMVRPQFRWTQPDAGWSYRLELRRSEDLSVAPLHVQTSSSANGTALDIDLTPGRYFWRVASVVPATGRQGPWGDLQAFRRVLPSPEMEPAQVEPGHVTVRWPALPHARAYDLQLARDDGFEQPLLDVRPAAVQYQIPSLAPGSYRLRLRSVSEDGFAGPWGQVQSFVVPEPAPPEPNPWRKLLLVLPVLVILGL